MQNIEIYDGIKSLLPDKAAENKNNSVTHTQTSEPKKSSYSKPLLPLSHMPHQNPLNMSQIIKNEIHSNNKYHCKFRGKVFILGLSKTATTSMNDILTKYLGFKCLRSPMISCGYYGLYYYYSNAYLPLYVATKDISWIMHSKPLFADFIATLQNATVFSDAPWNFLYPLYDQLIAAKHTKFILTVRDSTRDVVNSNMKMMARDYIKRYYKEEADGMQLDVTNFSKHANPRKWGLRIQFEQYWMLNARVYEEHNQNVLNYFEQRGRMNDLLIINLAKESRKEIDEQWFRITDFLGCDNVTEQRLPVVNSGHSKRANQIDFFPKNFTFRWWEYENYPKSVTRIWDLVKSMNGTYNETKWNQSRLLYSKIFEKKH